MKIVIVGATGTIGSKVAEEFGKKHELVKAGSKTGDIQLDICSVDSIKKFFEEIGSFDALISAAGSGHFGPITKTTPEDFEKGIHNKLLGQINLVLIGQHYIKPKGSFTLTSGVLSEDPVLGSTNLSVCNGGINSFVISAALDLPNGLRINAVSPGVVEDAPQYFPSFPGVIPVSMKRVVNGYVRSVLGGKTGQVIKVYSE